VRTFVVGDVHGQSQKLRRLLGLLRARAEPGDSLVFVGDYVDRGPNSRLCVELVLNEFEQWPGSVIPLRGNHEAMMLDFLSGSPRYDPGMWLENGGRETIHSYTGGWSPRALADAITPEHLDFLDSTRLWHGDEHGIYVHAGIPPGRAPSDAGDEVMWIREPFLESDYRWDRVVVFGHTPQYDKDAVRGPIIDREHLPWRPLDRPEKIGIDTGAGWGGPLTAVILPEREFVTVK
jgi:serine/threonine protein phosphatase 1